ncbi:hypothetical protein F5884DRAFT_789367 [Xylogone sp. PMI_703]|nr:hypothetical protein F5884DRAFT_789367 [Xylogone sp. PMI_703]
MAATETAKLRATIAATAREMLMSYQDGAAQKDPSIISRSLTPDCIRHIIPASFAQLLGLPPDALTMNNEPYQEFFAQDLKTSAVVRSEIVDLTVDVEARKAAARTIYLARFSNGDEMSLEFAWFVDFNEDGTKVKKIVEFADTTQAFKFGQINDKLRENAGSA